LTITNFETEDYVKYQKEFGVKIRQNLIQSEPEPRKTSQQPHVVEIKLWGHSTRRKVEEPLQHVGCDKSGTRPE
jgi:hypothetical protein